MAKMYDIYRVLHVDSEDEIPLISTLISFRLYTGSIKGASVSGYQTVSIKNVNQGVLRLKKYNPVHYFRTYFLCTMGSSHLILNSEKSKKHKHTLN